MQLLPEIPDRAREWRNDPLVWKWCRQYTLISEAQHERWLEKIEIDPTIKMFGLWDRQTPLGVCGLTSIDKHNQSAEFSLYIAPEQQCKDYGTSALTQLLRHAFYNLNLNRVWGEVFDGNPALGIFKSLGFIEEGRHREAYFRDGQFIDSLIISILRSDYMKGQRVNR